MRMQGLVPQHHEIGYCRTPSCSSKSAHSPVLPFIPQKSFLHSFPHLHVTRKNLQDQNSSTVACYSFPSRFLSLPAISLAGASTCSDIYWLLRTVHSPPHLQTRCNHNHPRSIFSPFSCVPLTRGIVTRTTLESITYSPAFFVFRNSVVDWF